MSDVVERPQGANHLTEGRVVDMFQWREERANAAATKARAAQRANPMDPEAEIAAYETMTEYIRAARQRTEAQRRVREKQAQALADSLRNGSYVGPRS